MAIILITLFFSSLIIIPTASGQEVSDALKEVKGTYDGEQFSKKLILEGSNFPDEVFQVKIMIFQGGITKDEQVIDVSAGAWRYETDISSWARGDYKVRLLAHNVNSTVIGQTEFIIKVESDIEKGIEQGKIFTEDFISKYENKEFSDKIKMSKTLGDNVDTIEVVISKDQKTKVEKTSEDLNNSWSFETSVKDWEKGEYKVQLIAKADNGTTLDSTHFNIKVVKEELFNMPLVCGVVLIIFIILMILLFILSLMKHKKIMKELRFEPKTVKKKLPMMSFALMLVTLLYVLGALAVCMTADLELIPFVLFIIVLGLLMLFTYPALSNRNYPNFILYIIFMILSFIIVAIAAMESETDAIGLIVSSGFVLAALLIFFLSVLLYWLTSQRGIFLVLVGVILTLVFFILNIVFIALAVLEVMAWWIAAVLGCVLTGIILLLGWMLVRNDIFYFETRDESQTHRGWRRTLNMFDILSTPRGLLKRDYDRKVMAKISYEQTHDKKVRLEVIQLRDWDSKPGRSQGRRLMSVFVTNMLSKEGPMGNKQKVAESVKYTTYSSDTDLNDKLDLCQAFGFQIQDSGKERGLDYYDLELVHKPFLGLGTPMGSKKKKKDYDKDSGYARDKDKDSKADEDRDHRYDYDHDREERRKERERESRAAYERDRERQRRHRDEEPGEDVEDWSSSRRSRERDHERDDDRRRERDHERDYERRRERERDHERDHDRDRGRRSEPRREPEPEAEKPKKRPPPPKIISD